MSTRGVDSATQMSKWSEFKATLSKWGNKHVRVLSLIPGASIYIAYKIFKQENALRGKPPDLHDHSTKYLAKYNKKGAILLAIPIVGNIIAPFVILHERYVKIQDVKAEQALFKLLIQPDAKIDVNKFKNLPSKELGMLLNDIHTSYNSNESEKAAADFFDDTKVGDLVKEIINTKGTTFEKRQYIQGIIKEIKQSADELESIEPLIAWLKTCAPDVTPDEIETAILEAQWDNVHEISVDTRWDFCKEQWGPTPAMQALGYLGIESHADTYLLKLHLGFEERCKGILSSVETKDITPEFIIAMHQAMKMDENFQRDSFSKLFEAHSNDIVTLFLNNARDVSSPFVSNFKLFDRIELAQMLLQKCENLTVKQRGDLLEQIAKDFTNLQELAKTHPPTNNELKAQAHLMAKVLMEFNKFNRTDFEKKFFTLKSPELSKDTIKNLKDFYKTASSFVTTEENRKLLSDKEDFQKMLSMIDPISKKLFEEKQGLEKEKNALNSLKNPDNRSILKTNPMKFYKWMSNNKQLLSDPRLQGAIKDMINELPLDMRKLFVLELHKAAIKGNDTTIAKFLTETILPSIKPPQEEAVVIQAPALAPEVSRAAAVASEDVAAVAQTPVEASSPVTGLAKLKVQAKARGEARKATKAEEASRADAATQEAVELATDISDILTSRLTSFERLEKVAQARANVIFVSKLLDQLDSISADLSGKLSKEDYKKWKQDFIYLQTIIEDQVELATEIENYHTKGEIDPLEEEGFDQRWKNLQEEYHEGLDDVLSPIQTLLDQDALSGESMLKIRVGIYSVTRVIGDMQVLCEGLDKSLAPDLNAALKERVSAEKGLKQELQMQQGSKEATTLDSALTRRSETERALETALQEQAKAKKTLAKQKGPEAEMRVSTAEAAVKQAVANHEGAEKLVQDSLQQALDKQPPFEKTVLKALQAQKTAETAVKAAQDGTTINDMEKELAKVKPELEKNVKTALEERERTEKELQKQQYPELATLQEALQARSVAEKTLLQEKSNLEKQKGPEAKSRAEAKVETALKAQQASEKAVEEALKNALEQPPLDGTALTALQAQEKAETAVREAQAHITQAETSIKAMKDRLDLNRFYFAGIGATPTDRYKFAKLLMDERVVNFLSAADHPKYDERIRDKIAESQADSSANHLTRLLGDLIDLQPPTEKSAEEVCQSILTCDIRQLPSILEPIVEDAHAQFTAAIAELESIKKSVEEIQGDLQELDASEKELQDVNRQINDLNREIAKLDSEDIRKGTGYKLFDARDRLFERQDVLRKNLTNAEGEREALQKDLEEYTREYANQKQKVENLQEHLRDLENLTQLWQSSTIQDKIAEANKTNSTTPLTLKTLIDAADKGGFKTVMDRRQMQPIKDVLVKIETFLETHHEEIGNFHVNVFNGNKLNTFFTNLDVEKKKFHALSSKVREDKESIEKQLQNLGFAPDPDPDQDAAALAEQLGGFHAHVGQDVAEKDLPKVNSLRAQLEQLKRKEEILKNYQKALQDLIKLPQADNLNETTKASITEIIARIKELNKNLYALDNYTQQSRYWEEPAVVAQAVPQAKAPVVQMAPQTQAASPPTPKGPLARAPVVQPSPAPTPPLSVPPIAVQPTQRVAQPSPTHPVPPIPARPRSIGTPLPPMPTSGATIGLSAEAMQAKDQEVCDAFANLLSACSGCSHSLPEARATAEAQAKIACERFNAMITNRRQEDLIPIIMTYIKNNKIDLLDLVNQVADESNRTPLDEIAANASEPAKSFLFRVIDESSIDESGI